MPLSLITAPIRPGVGGCIGCGWLLSFACGYDQLSIQLSAFSSNNIAIDFLSSGKIDTTSFGRCPNTSAYVARGAAGFTVAIWDAYLAGLWTSSTTIPVYVSSAFGGGETVTVQPATRFVPSLTKTATPPISTLCPPTLFGTITVYDDGTFTFT